MATKFKVEGIKEAIRDLELFKISVHNKGRKLIRKLAKLGYEVTSAEFADLTWYDDNDIDVRIEEKDGKNKFVCEVVADGDAVCFIEFGAGVYYNGTEPYPIERPPQILPIGEYGKGQGKREGWFYKDADGYVQYTHGMPAQMPMYKGFEQMRQEIETVVREVFK